MPFIILSLLIAPLVFAILAALNKPSRLNMIGSALACYFLSIILPLLRTLFVITACVILTGCAGTQYRTSVSTKYGKFTYDSKDGPDTSQKFDQNGNPNFGPKINPYDGKPLK